MLKGFGRLTVLVAVCFMVSTCSSQAATSVTFNGLTVDGTYTSITDPGTGVQFVNPTTPANGNFVLDYVNAYAGLPDITPGILLSANGYVPNGGVGAPYDFGFTMKLPTPSIAVSMIMDYIGGPATPVTLQGFDADNNLVATETITPAPGDFAEQPISFSSGSTKFVTVTLTPTNISDNFGAITYTVPEPGVFGIWILAAASCFLSRHSRVSFPRS